MEARTLILVGTDKGMIKKSVEHIPENAELYQAFRERPNPYGDGFASERILEIIEKQCGVS